MIPFRSFFPVLELFLTELFLYGIIRFWIYSFSEFFIGKSFLLEIFIFRSYSFMDFFSFFGIVSISELFHNAKMSERCNKSGQKIPSTPYDLFDPYHVHKMQWKLIMMSFLSFSSNIYLGETFNSYVCLHNDSTSPCHRVTLRSDWEIEFGIDYRQIRKFSWGQAWKKLI